jgi:hypothetical protein
VSRKGYLPASDLHRYRFARHKVLGTPIEDIAKEDGVKVSTIESSIRDTEARNAMYSLDALEASQTEVVMFNKDLEKMALHDSLQAEKKIYAESGEHVGQVIASEPDYDVRLQASQIITEKTKAIISRHVKGTSVSTQVNVVNSNNPSTNTFEDRLREVLKRRENPALVQNDLPANAVIDIAVEKAQDATSGDPAQG